MNNLEDVNILFITLDSCRYDSFLEADLPFIKKLGNTRKATAPGTYTLPSHMSYFVGYLPSVTSEPFNEYYSSDVKQLWRLESGRPRDIKTVGLMLKGKTIIEGYKNIGFKTLGFGGVRWFNSSLLQNHFDKFIYLGKSDKCSVFTFRKEEEFPLNHIDSIIQKVQGEKSFIFLNCPETHVPYDSGKNIDKHKLKKILERYSKIWGGKKSKSKNIDLLNSDFEFLKRCQIKSLESIDEKVRKLVSELPKPLKVIITSDHGECLGEDGNWGHGFIHETVYNVPLLISDIII